MDRAKVLVVDQDIKVRIAFNALIGSSKGYKLLGAAPDIESTNYYRRNGSPDLIVLGVHAVNQEVKRFIEQARQKAIPVVLVDHGVNNLSSLLANEHVVDTVINPAMSAHGELVEKVQVLAALDKAKVSRYTFQHAVNLKSADKARPTFSSETTKNALDAISKEVKYSGSLPDSIVAIGSSTGGPAALTEVLTKLPANSPGIVIVQHMPSDFTKALADRLNSMCAIEVKEAKDGDMVLPGRALIAPGGKQMELYKSGESYHVRVFDGERVNYCAPSVDVLFNSIADQVGSDAMGIILTGMGDDGARGLLAMHEAGATTIAQDEESSVVYGMPRAAVAFGGTDKVVSLGKIFRDIISYQASKASAISMPRNANMGLNVLAGAPA